MPKGGASLLSIVEKVAVIGFSLVEKVTVGVRNGIQ